MRMYDLMFVVVNCMLYFSVSLAMESPLHNENSSFACMQITFRCEKPGISKEIFNAIEDEIGKNYHVHDSCPNEVWVSCRVHTADSNSLAEKLSKKLATVPDNKVEISTFIYPLQDENMNHHSNDFKSPVYTGIDDLHGLTPLHQIACLTSIMPANIAAAEKFIAKVTGDKSSCISVEEAKQAVINAQDSWNRSALYYAATKNHREFLCFLLNNGAKDMTDSDGKTITDLTEDPECQAILLVSNSSEVNEDRSTILLKTLQEAFEKKQSCTLQFLLNHLPVNMAGAKNKYTPLHCAALAGDVKSAELLLDRGANPDLQDADLNTPAHLAARQNYSELLCLLLIRRANANVRNKEGKMPHEVATSKCKAILRIALGTTEEMNGYHTDMVTNMFQEAALYRELYTLRFLRDHDAPVDCCDSCQKYTPLHCAVCSNHEDVVELLLAGRRANIEAKELTGFTPLALSISKGFLEVSRKLVDHGASLKAVLASGTSILQLANGSEMTEMRRLINGAIVGCQQENGAWQFQCPTCKQAKKLTLFEKCFHVICADCKEEWIAKGNDASKLCSFCFMPQ